MSLNHQVLQILSWFQNPKERTCFPRWLWSCSLFWSTRVWLSWQPATHRIGNARVLTPRHGSLSNVIKSYCFIDAVFLNHQTQDCEDFFPSERFHVDNIEACMDLCQVSQDSKSTTFLANHDIFTGAQPTWTVRMVALPLQPCQGRKEFHPSVSQLWGWKNIKVCLLWCTN